MVETIALPQPIGNEIASVTNFRIRWQKTDIKPKGLVALQTKKGRRFVVKRLPFVHTAMWVSHTVFRSDCFQRVVPAMIFVETFALPQPIGNEIASVTNFRIRWQKTDKKQKLLVTLQTKRQTFCCQTSALCTHCNTLLHTVFISECFQLVVPAMIFVEMFALPQPIGNEIASVTNFRIRWQKSYKKQKGLPALQTKKGRRFVVKRLPCVHTAMWICTSVCTLVVNVVQGDNQRNEERNVPFVGFQFESVGDESYLPSYSAYDVAVAQYL